MVTGASLKSSRRLGAHLPIGELRERILAWYAVERREFPWRETTDPYAVLVSEVMLQQTQASRVAERFPRFMLRFPTVDALAAAPTSAVLAEWSGLGYNRRALMLRRAADTVACDGWPRDVTGLERLPGVGPYTARAVASLAFGMPVGVVDTNVRRWLLRRLGGRDEPGELQELADALATPGTGHRIADWTHATMELGASVCRARAPRCAACPIALGCPSRDKSVPVSVARQAPLRGSSRSYRGDLLRRLAISPRRELLERDARQAVADAADAVGPALDDAGWNRIVNGLERDGLLHRRRGRLRLGAATIEA